MIRVCLHGAESTGKSTLATALAARFACPVVPEYGRTYAETHGTTFAMTDLLAMAHEQDRLMREASAGRPRLLLLDTDPLMTAAWAEMLFGSIPAELLSYPTADLYLLLAPDVPWIEDGTRLFGTAEARARFAAIARDMLVRAGVEWLTVDGSWVERERQAAAAITRALSRTPGPPPPAGAASRPSSNRTAARRR